MKRAFKILSITGVLIIALAASAVGVLKSLDFSSYRSLISEQVKAATGRDLVISGDIDLEVSLNPALTVEGVSFANAASGSRPQMVTIGRLEAQVELWPLLFGDVRVQRLVIIGLDALLETDAEGRGNWEFAADEKEKPEVEKPDASTEGPVTLPVVNRVLVRDVKIAYVSGPGKRPLTVVLDSLDAGAKGADAPLELTLKGAYDATPFAVSGKLGSTRQLLGGGALSIALKAEALGASLAIDGVIAKASQAGGIDLAVKVAGDELSQTLKALSALAPIPADLPPIGPFTLSARLKGSPEHLAIGDLALSLGQPKGVLITVGGSIGDAAKGKELALDLVVEGRNLAPLAKAAGVDLGAFPPFRIAGKITDPAGGYAIAPFQAKIGVSDLAGRFEVSLASKRPNIRVSLESKLLDLDQLSPKGGKAPAKEAGGGKRLFPGDPLAFDGLLAADARIEFRADRLLAGGVDLGGVEATVQLRDGRLAVKPIKATVAGGRLAAELTVDGPKSGIAVKADVRGLDLGRLPKDLGIAEILSARLNASLDIGGSGSSVAAIMAGLKGRTRLVIREGRINSQALGIAVTGILDLMPWADSAEANKINCLVTHFDYKGGVATSRALVLDTNGMTVTGEGRLDLRDETIHMTVSPKPKSVSLASLALPIKIGGTFAEPSFAPDAAAVAKGAIESVGNIISMPVDIFTSLASPSQEIAADDPCIKALGGKPAKTVKAPEKSPETAEIPPEPAPEKGPLGLLEGVGKGIGSTLKGLFQ